MKNLYREPNLMTEAEEIRRVLSTIVPRDLVRILKGKFEIEKMEKFFRLETYHYPSDVISMDHENAIRITHENCLLLKFETLQKELPYKLLLILNLREANIEDRFINLQNDLLTISRSDGINKIVIWSLNKVPPRLIRLLKNQKTDILYTEVEEIKNTKYISSFFPQMSVDHDYEVVINKVADILVKRLKKLFHLVLSEIAAPIYNHQYGKSKVATRSLMELEEEIISGLMTRLKNDSRSDLAIDVGCGTGRHSFLLANSFRSVHGFDISPKMIKEAVKYKNEQGTNVQTVQGLMDFFVSDFEYEELLNEKFYHNRVNLIVASFGMGSFIEDTRRMLKRFYDWLRPGGILFLSFYNSESIVLKVAPLWRDTSLSAHIDVENKTLQVELTPDIIFQIYCRPFDSTVKDFVVRLFNIERIYTYPTITALLPNSMLEKQLSQELFIHVDKLLSGSDKFNEHGHYVMIVAQKPDTTLTGYKTVLEILNKLNCEFQILEHQPVFSVKEMMEVNKVALEAIIKTVVFSYKQAGDRKLALVVVPADKMVDKERLAQLFGVRARNLQLAPEKLITELGFPVGGIAPFGLKEGINLSKFIDSSLENIEAQWFYMGIGDNKKTLQLRKSDFIKIVHEYVRLDL